MRQSYSSKHRPGEAVINQRTIRYLSFGFQRQIMADCDNLMTQTKEVCSLLNGTISMIPTKLTRSILWPSQRVSNDLQIRSRMSDSDSQLCNCKGKWYVLSTKETISQYTGMPSHACFAPRLSCENLCTKSEMERGRRRLITTESLGIQSPIRDCRSWTNDNRMCVWCSTVQQSNCSWSYRWGNRRKCGVVLVRTAWIWGWTSCRLFASKMGKVRFLSRCQQLVLDEFCLALQASSKLGIWTSSTGKRISFLVLNYHWCRRRCAACVFPLSHFCGLFPENDYHCWEERGSEEEHDCSRASAPHIQILTASKTENEDLLDAIASAYRNDLFMRLESKQDIAVDVKAKM